MTSCAAQPDPIACIGPAMDRVKANGKELVKGLRKAAGKKMRIVGITYPDVILGGWVSGVQADQDLAKLSVVAFQTLLNPALKEMYESVGGRFVDVTKATGAYTPLEQTTTLAPYGVLPVAVAEVCKLTWYCEYKDIHANTKGYGVIAELIAKTLPRNERGARGARHGPIHRRLPVRRRPAGGVGTPVPGRHLPLPRLPQAPWGPVPGHRGVP